MISPQYACGLRRASEDGSTHNIAEVKAQNRPDGSNDVVLLNDTLIRAFPVCGGLFAHEILLRPEEKDKDQEKIHNPQCDDPQKTHIWSNRDQPLAHQVIETQRAEQKFEHGLENSLRELAAADCGGSPHSDRVGAPQEAVSVLAAVRTQLGRVLSLQAGVPPRGPSAVSQISIALNLVGHQSALSDESFLRKQDGG